MSEPVENGLKKIEWRMNILIAIASVQTVLLILIVSSYFVPSTSTLITLGIILVLLALLFRKRIPSWSGKLSRYILLQLLSAEDTGQKPQAKD